MTTRTRFRWTRSDTVLLIAFLLLLAGVLGFMGLVDFLAQQLAPLPTFTPQQLPTL